MQIYIIFIFITVIPNVKLYSIQNHNTKICANCKFFISNEKKCSKFGDMDIVTGKYNYEDANIVRKDDKCGKDAIFFKKNYFKFISITFDFLLANNLPIFCFVIVLFQLLAYGYH